MSSPAGPSAPGTANEPTGPVGDLDDGGRPHRPTPWWHTALRIAGLIVIAVVVVAVLRSRFPDPAQFWDALKAADWWWVVAALVLEMASIGMMIRLQRRLLKAFGVPVSFGRVGAITYSSTAISMSVPAGGAVSAGYVYRKFRASGANAGTAASVMLLSGILSVTALVVLYLVGLLLATWTRLQALGRQHPVITVLIGVVVLGLILVAIRLLANRRNRQADDRRTPRLDSFEHRHPKIGAAGRQALETFHRAGDVRPWDWNLVFTQSMANWLLDAASLYTATLAFELDIDLWKLALLYLGIQLVRQIPITPGGIGLIEASLLAGLVSAGAAQGSAAAAIVVYRLFSCWLLIPVGFTLMGLLAIRDRRRGVEANDAAVAGQAG
jgi:uncharacterized protein (TIRG00374 family)